MTNDITKEILYPLESTLSHALYTTIADEIDAELDRRDKTIECLIHSIIPLLKSFDEPPEDRREILVVCNEDGNYILEIGYVIAPDSFYSDRLSYNVGELVGWIPLYTRSDTLDRMSETK